VVELDRKVEGAVDHGTEDWTTPSFVDAENTFSAS
jgi:hypothetical protein